MKRKKFDYRNVIFVNGTNLKKVEEIIKYWKDIEMQCHEKQIEYRGPKFE